jgi:hypothetical protein
MLHTTRRAVAAAAAGLLGIAGLTTITGPAFASDPVTSSTTFTDGTITAAYSDTTGAAGDAVTINVTFTNTSWNDDSASYRFGATDLNGTPIFILDSCSTNGSPLAGTCETSSNGSVLAFTYIDPIPAGGTATATIHAHVNPGVAPGAHDVQQAGSFGSSMRKDFNPDVTYTVQAVATADLDVILAADAGPLLTSQITYGLSVHNSGPGAATASTVQVALPSQTYAVSGLPTGCAYATSTDVVTCDIGSIPNGATTNVSFKANLGLLSLGSLPATASLVSSAPADPNGANNTSSITCTTLTSLIISCPATEF